MKLRKFSKDEAKLFNQICQENRGKEFSYKNLVELFKEFKSVNEFIQRLIAFPPSPIIIKVRRGCYRLPTQPVYIEKLQRAWDYVAPKKEEKKSEIEKAIELLKQNGFKVLQKDFDLEKALESPNKPVEDFIVWQEL